jgi:hypothetical protein
MSNIKRNVNVVVAGGGNIYLKAAATVVGFSYLFLLAEFWHFLQKAYAL